MNYCGHHINMLYYKESWIFVKMGEVDIHPSQSMKYHSIGIENIVLTMRIDRFPLLTGMLVGQG